MTMLTVPVSAHIYGSAHGSTETRPPKVQQMILGGIGP
jgi:hypothetical protein